MNCNKCHCKLTKREAEEISRLMDEGSACAEEICDDCLFDIQMSIPIEQPDKSSDYSDADMGL